MDKLLIRSLEQAEQLAAQAAARAVRPVEQLGDLVERQPHGAEADDELRPPCGVLAVEAIAVSGARRSRRSGRAAS